MSEEFKIIDIGHQGYSIDQAITELEIAISDSIFSKKTKGMKLAIVHRFRQTNPQTMNMKRICSKQQAFTLTST